jgi:hypothetical protein
MLIHYFVAKALLQEKNSMEFHGKGAPKTPFRLERMLGLSIF